MLNPLSLVYFFVCQPVCLSVYSSLCLSICLRIYIYSFVRCPSSIFLSVYLNTCLSISLSVYLYIYLSIGLLLCQFFVSLSMKKRKNSVCLSLCLSVRPSLCLGIYLFLTFHFSNNLSTSLPIYLSVFQCLRLSGYIFVSSFLPARKLVNLSIC